MERMESLRGVMPVESMASENEMEKSVACAMKLQTDSDSMDKVNQAISDCSDVYNDEEDFQDENEGTSIQEINWYVEALQDAVTSICEEDETENKILMLMV